MYLLLCEPRCYNIYSNEKTGALVRARGHRGNQGNMSIFGSIKKKYDKSSLKDTVAAKVDLEGIAEGAEDAVENADEYNAAFGTGDSASKAEVLEAVFGENDAEVGQEPEKADGEDAAEKTGGAEGAAETDGDDVKAAGEDAVAESEGENAAGSEDEAKAAAAIEAAAAGKGIDVRTLLASESISGAGEDADQDGGAENITDSEAGPEAAGAGGKSFFSKKGKKKKGEKSKFFLTRTQIVLGTVILVIAVVAGFLFTSCGDVPKETISHTNRDDIYGTGDYVYSAITFTGSGMKEENTLSVRDMEILAYNDDDVRFEADYSMLTSGSELFVRKFTGVKLYEILRHAGLQKGLPDNTEVTLVSKDGSKVKITLGTIEKGEYACYDDPEADKPAGTDLPVILAFSCDDTPLIGPIGSDDVNREFTQEEGYIKSADNSGGPMRFIIGQKSPDDQNEGHCLKSVSRIIVGRNENKAFADNSEIKKDSMELRVYDDGDRESDDEYSCEDLREFASDNASTVVSNYYGDDGYYEGVSLYEFLDDKISHFDRTGKIRFTYDDNIQETIDLKYLKEDDRDFSDYVTEKKGLMITCVLPALGYSKDGKPADMGKIYALLPADNKRKAAYTTKRLSRIQVFKEDEEESKKHPTEDDRIAINGDGMKDTNCYSVHDLKDMEDIAVINGRYSGVSLYDLLKEMGIGVDADTIEIYNFKDDKVTIPVEYAEEKSYEIMIAFETALGEQMPEKRGSFAFKNGSEYLDDIRCINVTAKEGQWDHFAEGYEDYLDYEIKVSGSAVEGGSRTYTLKELERIGGQYTDKDSYAADEGKANYQGVLLEKIVEDNLKDDIKRPGAIYVISEDGYRVDLPVNNAFENIASRYQMNEERPAILAYSRNGLPMVPGKKSEGYVKGNQYGPLRLIVENQTSKWVSSVKEIVLKK